MNDPDWHLYRTFGAVLKAGSLSGAAKMLNITQPSAGRHVEELERQLQRSLVTRSPQGLQPTEAALILQPFAEAMAAAADAIVRHSKNDPDLIKGIVKVSASQVVGAEVLPAILAKLQRDHPTLQIELSPSDAVEDLLRRDADIAVRMVEPKQKALVARSVGTIYLGFYAHRIYIEKFGEPADPSALRDHLLIGFQSVTPFIRDSLAALRKAVPDFPDEAETRWSFRTDSGSAQNAALRAGAGIGVCHCKLAERDDNLLRVLPDIKLSLPTYVVMHEDLKASATCRTVFDALASGLRDYIGGKRRQGNPAA
ncbi:LysR family transcriptional regulator [Oryzifoliimicrobium ureilyticus]|uniref:LysR family transcriptional regulator n=1 Tax=Oryzifoliimicrobium ureilyticus TaxID=3113724 RepID=UPI00307656F5